jgi:predicted alpha/beta hydrolase family esterase
MAQQLFSDFNVILVPGLHDSGPGHWQTRWQRAHPEFRRVRQDDWSNPDLAGWSARLDQVRAADPRPALVVAHSFGCLAAVHSIAGNPRNVAGAFLAAPADPEKFGVTAMLPRAPLACPTVLIGSRDDPWMRADHAALWARRWGSEFVDAGAVGHINAESDLDDWPLGQKWLQLLYEQAHNQHPAMSAS